MRKIIALILGCLISYYLYQNWNFIISILGSKLAHVLMIYVVALGVIHLGGVSLKIFAVLFAMLEPVVDKYCYWYENTSFYKWLHRNDKYKY